METIREFRVEIERLQRRVRPQLRRPDQRADQVGHQHAATAAPTSSTATTRSTRANYFDTGEQARFHAQPVRRHARRPDRAAIALFYFVGYEGAARAARPDDLDRRARRQRAARHPARRHRSAINAGGRAVPEREFPRANGPVARQRARGLHLPVRADARLSTSCRDASTTTSARATSSSPATRSTTPTSACRPTTRSSRATFLSRNQFFTGEYRSVLSTARCNTTRFGFSRTRIGQNVEANTSHAAAAVRARPRHASATSTSAACSASGRRARRTCGWCRTCSACQDDVDAHARPPPAEGRRAGRALPGQHGQPDVQPRHLHLRQPARVPREPCRRASSASTPEAQFDRYWRFTLFGFYAQDEFQLTPRLTRERAACATSSRRCRTTATAATRRCST